MDTTPRILEIEIETFSSSAVYTARAYRKDVPTFLINTHTIRYYSFPTLDGVQENFLYSDIKRISFKDV